VASFQHCPQPKELDDLELLTGGALSPVEGYDELGSPVTIDLPAEADAELDAGRSIELVDPEGLPLARLTRAKDRSLTVTALTHAQYGPFRRLHLTPDAVRERYAGRTFVPVDDVITDAQLERLRAAGPLVVLALVGTGTPTMSGVGLLRATLRAVQDLDAAVVAVPLAAHDDPEGDAWLRSLVVANYAAGDPVLSTMTYTMYWVDGTSCAGAPANQTLAATGTALASAPTLASPIPIPAGTGSAPGTPVLFCMTIAMPGSANPPQGTAAGAFTWTFDTQNA